MSKSFQDGVDKIYDKLKSLGFTPDGKDLDSILSSIDKLKAGSVKRIRINVMGYMWGEVNDNGYDAIAATSNTIYDLYINNNGTVSVNYISGPNSANNGARPSGILYHGRVWGAISVAGTYNN